jgi:hypothetical protein
MTTSDENDTRNLRKSTDGGLDGPWRDLGGNALPLIACVVKSLFGVAFSSMAAATL